MRAAGQLLGRLDDDLAAAGGELLEPVLLDLALRVEAELPLDADLDPQPLAVEAVLVALVEAAQRLVALEDVLERPPPRRVDGELLVRGDRAVDERPLRAAAVRSRELPRRSARAPSARAPRARARWSPASSGSGSNTLRFYGGGRIAACRGVKLSATPKKGYRIGSRSNRGDVRGRGARLRRQGDRRLLGGVVRPVPRRRARCSTGSPTSATSRS